jgi:hypothetical protein
MEGESKTFYIVKVDDICLQVPVLFIGSRHGPVAPGPAWSQLNDDVAAAILVDVIVANPAYRDLIGRKLRALSA